MFLRIAWFLPVIISLYTALGMATVAETVYGSRWKGERLWALLSPASLEQLLKLFP